MEHVGESQDPQVRARMEGHTRVLLANHQKGIVSGTLLSTAYIKDFSKKEMRLLYSFLKEKTAETKAAADSNGYNSPEYDLHSALRTVSDSIWNILSSMKDDD